MPFAACLETCRKSRYRKKNITISQGLAPQYVHTHYGNHDFFPQWPTNLYTVAVWTEINFFPLLTPPRGPRGVKKCASIH